MADVETDGYFTPCCTGSLTGKRERAHQQIRDKRTPGEHPEQHDHTRRGEIILLKCLPLQLESGGKHGDDENAPTHKGVCQPQSPAENIRTCGHQIAGDIEAGSDN